MWRFATCTKRCGRDSHLAEMTNQVGHSHRDAPGRRFSGPQSLTPVQPMTFLGTRANVTTPTLLLVAWIVLDHALHPAALCPQTYHRVTPSCSAPIHSDCTTCSVPLMGMIKFVWQCPPQSQVPTPPSCSIPERASAHLEPMANRTSRTTVFRCRKLTFGIR